MDHESAWGLRPDLFAQLAATDPFQGRARRLFERGRVLAVDGNQADLRLGYDAHNSPLDLKEVPIVSGYVPRVGDWVAIQYEAGHSGAPWVAGPSMSADESQDSPGIGVFPVSSAEPSDPQSSTVYFDESLSAWRGWNGASWVDLPTRLHNSLTDLQGGAAAEYYHLSAAEHGSLQDLYDGDGMRDATVAELHFKSFDAAPTQWTNAVEIDGDFYLASNAYYDEATTYWKRVDNTKFAYLMCLHAKNDIAGEVVGGFAVWRAAPDGTDTIGNWSYKFLTVGGWENAYIVTEDRNIVGGGMNLEMDGSGAPPFSRFTAVAGNDTNPQTVMQRNSWYQGGDQWGRDNVADSMAFGINSDCTQFFWRHYPSGSGSPWATSAWTTLATLSSSGLLSLSDLSLSSPSNVYNLDHDSFSGFVANEHIDWTNASVDFRTSGNVGVGVAPSYPFHVVKSGAGNLYGLFVHNTSTDASAAAWGYFYTEGGGNVLLYLRRPTGYWNIGIAGADDTFRISRWYNLATPALSIAQGGGVKLANDLEVNGHHIGEEHDTDLLLLGPNLLTVNGDANATGVYRVDGAQVVTNQQSAIANIGGAGPDIDGACRAKVNSILAALRAHGLIAS